MVNRLVSVGDDFTLPAALKVADANLPSASKAATLAATFGSFINFTDPRIGGKGDGTTDNTAAFNAALALLATTGGTLFFPAGVYLINGTTDPVPGGVWLTGTGYDYHTPSSSSDKPRLMSVIRAGAVMTRLIQLGTDATISTSGSTGASIRNLVVDGDRKAATTVKTAGRRNRIIESEIYFGTSNALWIAGQNTHAIGNVIGQDNTGDVILVKGYYDNKIWDNQIRQPGTTGAAIHLHGDGANQTDIQRNHMWAGANAVAAVAKALIWLEATATNGVTNTLIQDNTIEGVLGPEILLDGVAGSAGIRGVDISGNRFYQNDNMPSDDTYSVIDTSGASISSITVTGNIINGRATNFRYKSILNLAATITSSTRIVMSANVGLYVGRILSGIVPPNRIHQYGNKIHNGTASVASDNNNVAGWSGDGTQKWVIWAHGLAGIPTTVTVTPGSLDATGPFFVEFDATNITVKYTTAPPAGTNNVKLNWFASV